MIDLETIKETGDGTRFDRATAVLIGIIAVLAACLAVVQVAQSQVSARGNILSSRLATDLAAHLTAQSYQEPFQLGSMQRAVLVAIEGTSRDIVALGQGDAGAANTAKGDADVIASDRLQVIAKTMGAVPGPSSSVEPYVRDLIAMTTVDQKAEADRQIAVAVAANDASDRSGRAVVGLSMVALAGVLVGLAAVLGEGRAGKITLLVAYGAVALACIALVLALR